MGDVVIGVINTHNYSANHDSAANKALRRGLQEGQWRQAKLHVGRRLRMCI
jgi:hypothetical protein